MRGFPALVRVILLALGFGFTGIHASAGSATLEERYHAALSGLTQDVRHASDPAEKRRILEGFVQHMQTGLSRAETSAALSVEDRSSLHTVLGKYLAYQEELGGTGGFTRVSDADLDEYAAYIRQDMEQAPVGGGIYISGGVLLIILLLILLLH